MEIVRTTCRLQFSTFFSVSKFALGGERTRRSEDAFDMCSLSNAIAKSIEKPKSCDLGFK